jgi:hypothetical protein
MGNGSGIAGLYAVVNMPHMPYMAHMAKPTIFPVKKLVAFDDAMAKAIDDFRFGQRLKTESDAIRRLIAVGFAFSPVPGRWHVLCVDPLRGLIQSDPSNTRGGAISQARQFEQHQGRHILGIRGPDDAWEGWDTISPTLPQAAHQ